MTSWDMVPHSHKLEPLRDGPLLGNGPAIPYLKCRNCGIIVLPEYSVVITAVIANCEEIQVRQVMDV